MLHNRLFFCFFFFFLFSASLNAAYWGNEENSVSNKGQNNSFQTETPSSFQVNDQNSLQFLNINDPLKSNNSVRTFKADRNYDYERIISEYENRARRQNEILNSQQLNYQLEKDSINNELKKQTENINQQVSEIGKYQNLISEQTENINQQKNAIGKYQNLISGYEAQISEQTENINQQKNAIGKYQNLARKQKKDLVNTQNHITELKDLIRLYQEDTSVLKNRNVQNLKEISEYKSKTGNLLRELSSLEKIYESLNYKYNNLAQERNSRLKEMKNLLSENQSYEKKLELLLSDQVDLKVLLEEKINLLKSQNQSLKLVKSSYDKQHEKTYLDAKSEVEERISILELAIEEYELKKKDSEFFFLFDSLDKASDLEDKIKKFENEIQSLELQLRSEIEKAQFSYDSFKQDLKSEFNNWNFKQSNYELSYQSLLDQVNNEFDNSYALLDKELKEIKKEKQKQISEREKNILNIHKLIDDARNQHSQSIKKITDFNQAELLRYDNLIANSNQSISQAKINFQESIDFIHSDYDSEISQLKSDLVRLEKEKNNSKKIYQSRKRSINDVLSASSKNLEAFLSAHSELKSISQNEISLLENSEKELKNGEVSSLKNKVNNSIKELDDIKSIHDDISTSVGTQLRVLDENYQDLQKKYIAKKKVILFKINQLNQEKQKKIDNLNTAYSKEINAFNKEKKGFSASKEDLIKSSDESILNLQSVFSLDSIEQQQEGLQKNEFEINQLKRELSQINLTHNTQIAALNKQKGDKFRKLAVDKNNFLFEINSFSSKLKIKENQGSIKHKSRINSLNKEYKAKIRELVLQKQKLVKRVTQLKKKENIELSKLSSSYQEFADVMKDDFMRHKDFVIKIDNFYSSEKQKQDNLYTSLKLSIDNQISALEVLLKLPGIEGNISNALSSFEVKGDRYVVPQIRSNLLAVQKEKEEVLDSFSQKQKDTKSLSLKFSDKESNDLSFDMNVSEVKKTSTNNNSNAILLLEDDQNKKNTWVASKNQAFNLDPQEPNFVKIQLNCLNNSENCLNSSSYISKYEVTNAEFKQFRPEHNSGSFLNISLDKDDQPVVNVTFKAAQEYANWLTKNSQDASLYRLPTELEWEYIALGGLKTEDQLPWYQNPSMICNVANVADQSITKRTPKWVAFSCNDKNFVTSKIGSYLPNFYGVYDIFGNVWEMVCRKNVLQDNQSKCLDKDYYITKGGSWYSHPQSLKKHFRYVQSMDSYSPHVGFRLVKITQ